MPGRVQWSTCGAFALLVGSGQLRCKALVIAWARACVAVARNLEADEVVNTSGDLALEEFAVRSCKLVEENCFAVGVGNGEVVDQNKNKNQPLRLRV
eukprot:6201280-Pleurochrysis_carterae.AAC.14